MNLRTHAHASWAVSIDAAGQSQPVIPARELVPGLRISPQDCPGKVCYAECWPQATTFISHLPHFAIDF